MNPLSGAAAAPLGLPRERAHRSTAFLERPPSGERVVLVIPQENAAAEFSELARAAGAQVVAQVRCREEPPRPRHYIGQGKLEETRESVRTAAAELVLFDADLSAAQERNLERALQCRVADRTGLILDIFAQRARSSEGKLQVELACLKHLSTRLVRGWTHLERQRGGIGLRSGPGEAQLETDRRVIRRRIQSIGQRLEQLRRTRSQGRRARRRAGLPTVLLVGYTNAGKSTLFNRMTCSSVRVADQLFATLDSTLRCVALPGGTAAVLGDTVGFIQRLPHSLVEAFHATLEEAAQAALLVHVVDASCEDAAGCRRQVESVLEEIGADRVPRLEVFNKIDLLSSGGHPLLERDSDGVPRRVHMSAATGKGAELLAQALAECLSGSFRLCTLRMPPARGRLRASLYEQGVVLEENVEKDGWLRLKLCLQTSQWRRLLEQDDLQLSGGEDDSAGKLPFQASPSQEKLMQRWAARMNVPPAGKGRG